MRAGPALGSGATGPGTFDQVLADAYAPVAYLAWIPNLVVAELFLRVRGLPALRVST